MPTKQISLEVPASQYRFMLQLLEALPFVRLKLEEPAADAERDEARAHIRQGFKELKLMRQGKLQSRPVEEFLDELPD